MTIFCSTDLHVEELQLVKVSPSLSAKIIKMTISNNLKKDTRDSVRDVNSSVLDSTHFNPKEQS